MNPNEYKGWIVSSSLVKRSFAVFGHNFLGQLLIMLPILIIVSVAIFALGGYERIKEAEQVRSEEGGETITLEDGWSRYSVEAWGLSFDYPSNWEISEEDSEDGNIQDVVIRGEDGRVFLTTRGIEDDVGVDTVSRKYTSTISGKQIEILELREGGSISRGMSICHASIPGGVTFTVSGKEIDTDLLDRITSSIICTEPS